MAGRRKKQARAVVDLAAPTPEQFERGAYERATLAYRRVPVIETLRTTGKLNQRQFDGLARYRDIGIKCERSEIMDSCQRLLHVAGNDGDGPSHSSVRALIELGWLERELRALRDIARAIAIEDMTVSAWAMKIGGSVMRERTVHGATIRTYEPRRKFMDSAMIEIRSAGDWLADAIGA